MHTENDIFNKKTSETKKVVLILKKYFASTIQDFFHFYKKGFLNSQSVRIRVQVAFSPEFCLVH
jgi:hypothetical protein